MSDYIPATRHVRTAYINDRYREQPNADPKAEFRQWLADHDQAVAAQALTDAADALPWTVDPPGWLRARADRITDAAEKEVS